MMLIEAANSLYDSFNARFIASSEIPDTFVAPSSFALVCQRNHTLIVGPRGSGKTTILKMLTPAALEKWPTDLLSAYRKHVDYVGIFVPADSVWAKSKDLFLSQFEDEKLRLRAQMWLFSQHIIAAFVEALSELRRPTDSCILHIDRLTESHISKELAISLSLADVNPSFLSISIAIENRVQSFFRMIQSSAEEMLYELPFAFDPIETLSACVRKVNIITGKREQRWALLFDEMEIVDAELRNLVLSKLRSGEKTILYKVAIAPYLEDISAFAEAESPAARDDFSVVELWCPERDEIEDFCQRVTEKLLESAGIGDRSAFDMLGPSVFDDERQHRNNKVLSYVKESRIGNSYFSLLSKDKSFQRYVAQNKIPFSDLKSLTGIGRAQSLRKVRSIVVMRDEYLKSDQIHRGRRKVRAYSGATAIFAASEGNPRWLLSMLAPLVNEYKYTLKRVSDEAQYGAIATALEFFQIKLYNMSLPSEIAGFENLLDLLDRFGGYFRNQIVGPEFHADPVLTISVDENTPLPLKRAIGSAIKIGALVYADKTSGEYLKEGIAKKRLRISYLLSPRYKLPFIKGKSRSVSFILQEKIKAPVLSTDQVMLDLWEIPDVEN